MSWSRIAVAWPIIMCMMCLCAGAMAQPKDPPAPGPPAPGPPAPAASAPCAAAPVVDAPVLPPEQAVVEARKSLEQLDYERALALLQGIGPDTAPLLRMQALEIAATVHLILGRAAIAQPLLEELYFLAPAFLLIDASLPARVTKMFDEEAARPHTRAVKLEVRPAAEDLRGFVMGAGGASSRVDVACRAGMNGAFLPIPAQLAGGEARMRLPSDGVFQCQALATDRDGLPLGRLGTPHAPLTLVSRKPTPPPPADPVWKRWYFWTGIGAAVATGVVVAAVVASRKEPLPAADITVDTPAPRSVAILRW